MQIIYLAGGCFWGTEKFFDQFDGVLETEVGYANGPTANPSYQQVCADRARTRASSTAAASITSRLNSFRRCRPALRGRKRNTGRSSRPSCCRCKTSRAPRNITRNIWTKTPPATVTFPKDC